MASAGQVAGTLRIAARTGLQGAIDWLLPPRCADCDDPLWPPEDRIALCETCREAILETSAPACPRCGKTMTPAGLDARGTCPACAGRRFAFDRVIRLGIYDGPMRAAVLRMKKDENRPLAEGVGRLLLAMRAIDLARLEASLVVPIPMYWWRRYRRGTNSARTVAEVLARRLELPLLPRLLVRRRNTLPHSNLSPEARRRNVRDAFAASRRYNINGLSVLLVDDILTTGATCHAAARELRRAGAREVTVAVAARAEGIA